MKKFLFLALCLLVAGGAMAQEKVFQTPRHLLVPHFTDASKKIVLPDDYFAVYPEIHSDLIAISSTSMIYYNLDGECVYGTDYPLYRVGDNPYFKDGVVLIQRSEGGYNRKTMLLMPNGTYRDIPTGAKSAGGLEYDITRITAFENGVALAQKGGMWNGKQLFVDTDFKEIYPALQFPVKSSFGDFTLYPLRDNRRLFYDPSTEKYGYADAGGNIVIKAQYKKAHTFSDGMAAVMVTDANYVDKWGFINTAGTMVVPATYRVMPGRFSEGLAPVKIGNDESSYVMNYIDKAGKRQMTESVKWNLNEFHDGHAWVGTGCDKLFVMDRNFVETRNVTDDFYHSGNGFGVCSFQMQYGSYPNYTWGIDFPNNMQALNQGGVAAGEIFAADGTLLYSARDERGDRVLLNYPTQGDLMLCSVRIRGQEARLGSNDKYISCFINTAGEIVYYFVTGYEGFEGTVTPVSVK